MKRDQPTRAAGTNGASAVPMRESAAGAQPLLGAAEYVAYEDELLRLRRIRDPELPERLREARGFVAADTAAEIGHIQEERTVMDARIARLEDLLHTATVVPDGAASDLVTLGVTVEVAHPRQRRRANVPRDRDRVGIRRRGALGALAGGAGSHGSSRGRPRLGTPAGRPDRAVEILGITAALAEAC